MPKHTRTYARDTLTLGWEITVSGTIGAASLIPTGSITITAGKASTTAVIALNGQYGTSLATGALPASKTPYDLTFSYGGDANFNSGRLYTIWIRCTDPSNNSAAARTVVVVSK